MDRISTTTLFRLIPLRTIVLISLLMLPLVVYLVGGIWAMWSSGLFFWIWWLLPACWLLTWLIAVVWKRRRRDEPVPLAEPYWTPRDQKAMAIVQQFEQQVDQLTSKQLQDPHFYLNQVQALAENLARHYHIKTKDTYSALTLIELLAVARLVAEDLEEFALESIPGSRVLTIKQWRVLKQAPQWFRRLSNSFWLASIVLNPANVVRYGTSKATLTPVTSGLKSELLGIGYSHFIRQIGYYLIEMNSGRLRAGSTTYRHAFSSTTKVAPGGDAHSEHDRSPDGSLDAVARPSAKTRATKSPAPNRSETATDTSSSSEARTVSIAVVGQTGAGKSSLINALIGGLQAQVDLLPQTEQVDRYRWSLPDQPIELTLLDTPGYGQAGSNRHQLGQIQTAVQQADAVLLVMAANRPDRQDDRHLLDELDTWYRNQPRLKPGPRIGVLTHIDLLPPPLEWKPPYPWDETRAATENSGVRDSEAAGPREAKADHIAEAVRYTRELFAERLATVVPVCSDVAQNRDWGVYEFLLPALVNTLDEFKAVAMLTAFERSADRDRYRLLAGQFKRSAKLLVEAWRQRGAN